MPPFGTDEILWYNNGVWGDMGYAVPNHGGNPTTLNTTIANLVSVIGRNLFAIMHHSDADSRTPPTINTLIRVHRLNVRLRQILGGRALTPATPRMEPTHDTPAQQAFLVYPCPYFKVRNAYLKEWAQLTFNALAEAMQHTENRVEFEISTQFAGTIGQYFQRIYVRMATELFGIALADAQKPDFVLTDAMIASYDPTKWFTSTELVDTIPPFDRLPTENDLRTLADGIPANLLVNLQSYPLGGIQGGTLAMPGADTVKVTTAAAPSFPAPPAP